MEEQRITHPSFGFIRANRVSGSATLFDSVSEHQHYVNIEIGQAEQVIAYGESKVHGGLRGKYLSLAMTEAQFAQFITSMNVGSGSPCTIEWVNGARVEAPPPDQNTAANHAKMVRTRMTEVVEGLQSSIDKLESLRAKGKAGKAELADALNEVQYLKQHLVSNLPFYMERFEEQMEKVVEKSKIDINAHAVMMGQRLMMEAAQGKAMLALTMEED